MFATRRGLLIRMISDNAKMFKGAARIIGEIMEHPNIHQYLENSCVNWVFNVEKAPWLGGTFEQYIQFSAANQCSQALSSPVHSGLFGYFPKPQKSCLVIQESILPQAHQLFNDLDIKITTSSRFLGQLDTNHQKIMLRSIDSRSSWLSILPTTKDNFDLSCTQFRDAICLRYSKLLLKLPPNCDGCSYEFTTSRALDSLIGDISARGIWQSQATALFDVRVIDSNSPSYRHVSPKAVLKSAKTAKKNKYSSACESIHTSFTPLCFTIDGLVGVDVNNFLKKLAGRLSLKWDQPYSQVIYWVRKRLSFALLRATGLCLRGTRSKLKLIHFEDGAGISPHSDDY
uniref:Uncharacterized protein n=1 Tax=Amphimedon queenslandica TaxID=400682 RepID=A0A1X7UDW6_AMPQE